jgi:hypothetical protein
MSNRRNQNDDLLILDIAQEVSTGFKKDKKRGGVELLRLLKKIELFFTCQLP